MSRKKSSSPAAYNDVQFVMNLAIQKPGLRYECDSVGKAVNFKHRCNIYRNMLREQAQDALDQLVSSGDHTQYGKRAETIYDPLVIRQVDAEGKPSRQGAILVFDHHKPEGRIIDPETGEEIPVETPSLGLGTDD